MVEVRAKTPCSKYYGESLASLALLPRRQFKVIELFVLCLGMPSIFK